MDKTTFSPLNNLCQHVYPTMNLGHLPSLRALSEANQIMQNFILTPEQQIQLRLEHKRAKKSTLLAYRINAVLLLGTGWTWEQVQMHYC